MDGEIGLGWPIAAGAAILVAAFLLIRNVYLTNWIKQIYAQENRATADSISDTAVALNRVADALLTLRGTVADANTICAATKTVADECKGVAEQVRQTVNGILDEQRRAGGRR